MSITIDGQNGISASGGSGLVSNSTTTLIAGSNIQPNSIGQAQIGNLSVITGTSTLGLGNSGNVYLALDNTGNVLTSYAGFTFISQSQTVTPAGRTRLVYIPTGANQSLVVPAGVQYIYAKLWGAGGGGGSSGGWTTGSRGGGGGHSRGIIPVVPGETLTLVVGVAGQTNYSGGTTNLYGGGGGMYNNTDNRYAGSGGGYCGIFRGSVSQAGALLIAGGGGGGGCSRFLDGNWGGAGGGASGQTGNSPYDGRASSGGGPGTQTAAGATGVTQGNAGGGSGALAGGYGSSNAYGGGGGGGYWGGGGGGYYESNTMAGGGGGSGFIGPTVIQGATFTGEQQIPAMYEDPDLAKTIDTYNAWSKYAWGGDIVISTSQYTSTGGGGAYCVIYY